ncbi:lactate utilization protein C [Actinomadura namibiensis]|uniref:L-lactate dehydrogenase complex protein LldG n=1 Tax=Actinomadura namibiensis TaxID=182080 RepID=A0A7W3LRD4_ACTNM|nr:LUD domain-containing protein [Actinomadura namibiensis]MBA8952817.1 L-lactate dehydrogenase complex protein LldG [Actinomadura namibiensis]
MTGREEVLRRVRAALGPARGTAVPVPRGYRRRLGPEEAADRADVIALFTERVADHRASVRHVHADELATAVAAALWGREAKRVIVPADLPFGWLAELDGVHALADTPATDAAVLESCDGAVTGCAVAVARTGTVVLDGGRAQGRRALSLVPDHHLCVVHADQIVGTVAEALPRLDPARPLTWISGPAATLDLGGTRAPGPHGPRTLEILVVED